MIEGHGDDLYRYGHMITANFSSNIATRPDIDLQRLISSHLPDITSYPEPDGRSITALIARSEGIDADTVMATAGIVDAIYLLAQAYAGSSSAIAQPAFREYEDACTMFGHHIAHIFDFDGTPESLGSALSPPLSPLSPPDIMWICNPANPTGRYIDSRRLTALADALPSTLFIIDQAYEDYTTHPALTDAEAVSRGNLVLLHSLTKRYGVPGLRIGYLAASPSVISRIASVRRPWTLNSFALALAPALLTQYPGGRPDLAMLLQGADFLRRRFTDMGLHVTPSHTSFLTARLPHSLSASALKEHLAHHGVLIRDASNFRGLTPSHFRVAAQSPENNLLLIRLIAEWLQSNNS